MTTRRVLQALTAALLTTFALVSVAQPSVAATGPVNGSITGVASLDGKGQPGVKAILLRTEDDGDQFSPVATTTTNSKGAYTFPKVAVWPDIYGYLVQFTDSTHTVVSALRGVQPKPNKTVTRNATLKLAGTISGTVSRANGASPHDVTVTLSPGIFSDNPELDKYAYRSVLHAHTSGSFEFVGLPAGKYTVQFSDDGGTYLDQCYSSVLAKYEEGHYPGCSPDVTPEATAVSVVGGHKATLGAQTMSHLAKHISGTVTDTDGHVLKGIDVVAFPEGDNSTNGPLWNSVSHSTGNFKISTLPAGNWQLFADDDNSVWAPQWFDRKPGQDGSTVVPGDTTGVNITMLSRSIIRAKATAGTKSATFDVTTTRKAGGPRPGGSVTVNQGSKTTTADLVNGHAVITLSGLTPGHRTITVTYSGNSSTAGTSKDVVVIVK